MLKWLRCRLGGHKINLFPVDAENVARLAYTCSCQRAWISREVREQTLNDKLDEFEHTGAA